MSVICSEESVRQYVRFWVSNHAKKAATVEEIDPSANFVATGVIDSMAFVKLLMDTESEFGLELDFSELDPSEFLSVDGFTKSVMDCIHAI